MDIKRIAVVTLLMCAVNASAGNRDADRLFDLVGRRLALMDEVAAWKWQHDAAIEDPARETVVLDRAAHAAVRAGLTRESSRAFFRAQIEAAKEIQRARFARWRNDPEGRPAAAPDLTKEIRPKLIELGDLIVAAIRSAHPLDDSMALRQRFDRAVDIADLSEETGESLYNTLLDIAAFDNRLDRILAAGEIRIGTTGDYAPFSFESGNRFEGIDIELAQDLATSLGVDAVFVRTSWPGLMQDLANDRFDIGMSGISRTLARQRVASFSLPYHKGGKTPVARCADIARLDTLEKIDQEGVRVIVNPGGTNHRFVSQHLTRAEITIFEDNRTIFDEIAAGRADVMITDAIEVRLKAAEYEALCPTMPGETLTYQEKAYLMPRDRVLRDYVDTWLSLRLGDGTVEAVFDAASSFQLPATSL